MEHLLIGANHLANSGFLCKIRWAPKGWAELDLTEKHVPYILAVSAGLARPVTRTEPISKGSIHMASVLQQLQIGQKVCIKESGSMCYVAAVSDDQPGMVITELASEYIVFEDETAGVTTRIPVYLIRTGDLPAQPVPTAA
jgi:hypothetical protein